MATTYQHYQQRVKMAMAATAAAAAMAAGARDATRLEPLVCFFIFCLFYYTNVFFLGPRNASK
jgi:hypothetical protein